MLFRSFSLIVVVSSMLAGQAAHASFVFNTGTLLYGQEQPTWCGAATGQMILKQGGVTKTQTEVWNKIDASREDSNFFCDPAGLKTTLNAFDTVQKDHWKVYADTDQDHIIELLMESMVKANRPLGLLVDGGAHWVAWVGFTSDIDPLKGDATLLSAILNDPRPVGSGMIQTLTSAAFTTRFSANTFGTTFKDKYVAVAVPESATVLLILLGFLLLLVLDRPLFRQASS
jgi:hypothetical protein